MRVKLITEEHPEGIVINAQARLNKEPVEGYFNVGFDIPSRIHGTLTKIEIKDDLGMGLVYPKNYLSHSF